MTSIDEKRVYAAREGKREAFVATAMGVVVVAVSGDVVGDFGLEYSGAATAASARDGLVAVATADDVLLTNGESFSPLGFGAAVAVALPTDGVVAATAEGRIARRGRPAQSGRGSDAARDPGMGGSTTDDSRPTEVWTELGTVDRVRAIDGRLVAAADGVHRITDGGLTPAGLSDVRDVAAVGRPLAATGEGLYALGNGWLRLLDGPFRAVAVDPVSVPGGPADDPLAVAVADRVYVRSDDTSDPDPDHDDATADGGAWRPVELPTDDPVVDVAAVDGVWYAVTEDGTFVVDAGEGPRTQPIGIHDVAGLAVR